jgi:hypothetical protein
VVAFAPSTNAQPAKPGLQEFRVEDVASIAGLAVEQLKSRTIAFIDRPSDELIDPDSGLLRFEDWAQAKPVQKQTKRVREKLHMYVAVARFALARAPEQIDLAGYVSLPFLERTDPAIKHRAVTSAEAVSPKDPRAAPNQHPLRRWCEARPVAICIHSRYQFEGKLPLGIQLANKIRESNRKIADHLEFESELTLRSPAEVAEMGLASLTGLDSAPVGAIEQNIYYVNQVMQFGKLLAVFQRHPREARETIVSVFMALAVESSLLNKKKDFPVLRNLIPAQVLSGKSSFNTGNSISAGLPVYARNQVKAIAGILERR